MALAFIYSHLITFYLKKYLHKIINNNWIKIGLALAATPMVIIIALIFFVLIRTIDNVGKEIETTGQWWLILIAAFVLSLIYLSVEPTIYKDRKRNKEVNSLIFYWKDQLSQKNTLPSEDEVKAVREIFFNRMLLWDPWGANAPVWRAFYPDEKYPKTLFGIVDSYLEYCDNKKALMRENKS